MWIGIFVVVVFRVIETWKQKEEEEYDEKEKEEMMNNFRLL